MGLTPYLVFTVLAKKSLRQQQQQGKSNPRQHLKLRGGASAEQIGIRIQNQNQNKLAAEEKSWELKAGNWELGAWVSGL